MRRRPTRSRGDQGPRERRCGGWIPGQTLEHWPPFGSEKMRQQTYEHVSPSRVTGGSQRSRFPNNPCPCQEGRTPRFSACAASCPGVRDLRGVAYLDAGLGHSSVMRTSTCVEQVLNLCAESRRVPSPFRYAGNTESRWRLRGHASFVTVLQRATFARDADTHVEWERSCGGMARIGGNSLAYRSFVRSLRFGISPASQDGFGGREGLSSRPDQPAVRKAPHAWHSR